MNTITNNFKDIYKREDYKTVYSPYRICPLGAHVDHQHGLVTGMAIDYGIELVFAPTDGEVHITSLDFPKQVEFNIDKVPAYTADWWGNYIQGAVLALKSKYKLNYGLEGVIGGSLPVGGLSSSAAVMSCYLKALAYVNGLDVDKKELIQLGRFIENKYIGLNNGILDQSSNILSKKEHLLYLDTKTEKYELVKMPDNMPEFEIVVVYSGISKQLISTDYNNRVDECKAAAWYMQALEDKDLKSFDQVRLRDVNRDLYEKTVGKLPERFKKRAKHFFSENKRVKQGVKAWKSGDIETLGKLIFNSGESSVKLYECGCPELIEIYNILCKTPGVYGARFSGAGYRGCCIGLINPKKKESITKKVTKEYTKKYPKLKDRFQINYCKTDDGVRII